MSDPEDLGIFPADLQPPLIEVIADFDESVRRGERREATQFAYAIAMRLQAEGRIREAVVYARRCLELVRSMPGATIEDVTSTQTKVGGVYLPELLHEGVVRARLGHLIDV
jgi:hypothetical protein